MVEQCVHDLLAVAKVGTFETREGIGEVNETASGGQTEHAEGPGYFEPFIELMIPGALIGAETLRRPFAPEPNSNEGYWNFCIAAECGCVHCRDNSIDAAVYGRPLRIARYHDGNSAAFEVLLVLNVFVRG
ncbi:MAG: hypothetical protein ACLQVN_21415 [Bryobacteraceae bacterium]